jgi:hypothetical protein
MSNDAAEWGSEYEIFQKAFCETKKCYYISVDPLEKIHTSTGLRPVFLHKSKAAVTRGCGPLKSFNESLITFFDS